MTRTHQAVPAGSGKDSRFQRGRAVLWRLARILFLSYVMVLLMMMFLENALIFPAPRYPTGNWQHGFEDVHFQSADGTKLHGLFLEHENPHVHILFCHGNGEHVAYTSDLLDSYRHHMNATVFAFDYRGYGRSEGKPHEQGVLDDGQAAHQWLAKRVGIRQDEIVLIGRSLGGAVAVDLAATNGARALVIERSFSSMPDVAAKMYPFLPVRFLMRTKFDSVAKIGSFPGPILQSHGTADTIIPYEFGRKLFDAAPSDNKQFYDEEEMGHNDPYTEGYWRTLQKFLRDLDK